MQKTIKVFAPATVANVTCGFDILGFAVDAPGDEVILSLNSTSTVRILEITGDDGQLPLDPLKNTVSVAILHMLKFLNSNQGVDIVLHKRMPLGSGLGSSAASSAAGVVALNHLLDCHLSKRQLVMFAMEGERVACGSAHADNVAPAIFGGFTLIRSSHPLDTLDVISINTPKDLYCSIIHPNIKINTWVARGILNPMIKLTDAVTQWGNVAGLIAGLMSDDYALIARSLTDVIVEPLRAKLIPGFYDIKNAALEAGALGVGISGSGPAIFALSNSQAVATKVVAKMQESAATAQLLSETYVSKINSNGVKIID